MMTKIYKNILILIVGIAFSISFCSQKTADTTKIAKKYPSQRIGEIPTEYLLLRFYYKQDSLTLQQVRRYAGKLPLNYPKIEGAEYRLIILDSLDQPLFVHYFPTPGKVFYDQLDSSGKVLSGGQSFLPEGSLELKIPYFHNLHTLEIISPQEKIIWQTNRTSLLGALTK